MHANDDTVHPVVCHKELKNGVGGLPLVIVEVVSLQSLNTIFLPLMIDVKAPSLFSMQS